jgi:hypothetical protein
MYSFYSSQRLSGQITAPSYNLFTAALQCVFPYFRPTLRCFDIAEGNFPLPIIIQLLCNYSGELWSYVYAVIPAPKSGLLVAAQLRISVGRRDVSNKGEFSPSTLSPLNHDIIVRNIFQERFIIT